MHNPTQYRRLARTPKFGHSCNTGFDLCSMPLGVCRRGHFQFGVDAGVVVAVDVEGDGGNEFAQRIEAFR